MAVTFEAAIQRFRGLSTDQKPGLIPAQVGGLIASIPAGSTFTELDTGDLYVWNGSVLWVLQEKAKVEIKAKDVVSLLEEMIDLQKRMIFAMTEDGWDLDYEDLMDEKLPDC